MRKMIVSLSIMFFFMGKLSAQNDLKSIIPLTPNAAAIAKYGETPVSKYSGVPNITIPLYTIQSHELQLSLSLSYHAGGNKVETIASWVGLGWSVNSIPSISRSINGLADEGIGGFLYKYNGKSIREIYEGRSGTSEQQGEFNNYLRAVEEGNVDPEPDVYYYSLLGRSGKFYYDVDNQKYITYPYDDLKISFDISLNAFTIVSDDGTSYVFNVPEQSSTRPTNIATTVQNFTTWWVSKIQNSNKTDEISFIYGDENHLFYARGSTTKHIWVGDNGNCMSAPPLPDYENIFIQTSYVAKPLSKIIFKGGSLEFNVYNSEREDLQGGHALQSIKILNTDQTVIKQFDFIYNYATSGGSSCSGLDSKENKWLFLSELKENGGLETKGQHLFQYNVTNIPPCRTSPAQDFWGYYNGKTLNQDLVPSSFFNNASSLPMQLSGADRFIDENYTQFGIIRKIQYPTGGYEEFLFENNDANNSSLPLKYTKDMAGLEAEETITTNYYSTTFQINNLPDPFLNNGNVNGGSFINIAAGNFGCDVSGGSSSCAYVTIKGISSNNTHINYPITGNLNGIYLPNGTYLIEATFNQSPPQYQSFYTAVTWDKVDSSRASTNRLAGGLRVKEIKTHDGISAQNDIIQKFRYVDGLNSTVSSGDVLGTQFFNYKDNIQQRYDWEDPIMFVTNHCYRDYIRLKSYSNIQAISQSGSYVGYSNVIKESTEIEVTGVSEFKFNNSPDLIDPTFPYAPSESQEHLRGQPSQQTDYRKTGASYIPVTRAVFDYTDHLLPVTSFGLKVANPIIYSNSDGTTFLKPLPQYRSYLFYSSIFQLTKKTDYAYDSDDPTKILHAVTNYTYNPQHLKLNSTKTSNSMSDQIETRLYYPQDLVLTGSEEEARVLLLTQNNRSTVLKQEKYKNTNNLLERITTQYKKFNTNNIVKPYELIQTLGNNEQGRKINFTKYNEEGNLLEQLKENDIKVAYIWDYKNKYPVAEVQNAPVADIAYTSFEADGVGNWLGINFSNVQIDITAPSGKKVYNLSSTSLTKEVDWQKTYIISYWSKNGPVYISGDINTKTGGTLNGWTHYEAQGIQGAPEQTTLIISGNAIIDDLKLYPKGAQMTTYTYEPLIGITSQCDINNRITYYEYDGFGRLSLIRDQDKNILKKFCYHYQGQVEACTQGCTNTAPNWQNTTTAIKCKIDGSGSNTGEQEQEQRDNNNCSPTYNQLQWVVVGSNTTACPLPAPAITYARLSYENLWSDGYSTYGDVVVRFYSDAAGTIPLSVSNMPVYYTESNTCYWAWSSSVTANSNAVYIVTGGNLSYQDSVYDPDYGYEYVTCNVDYWLDSHSGYTIIY